MILLVGNTLKNAGAQKTAFSKIYSLVFFTIDVFLFISQIPSSSTLRSSAALRSWGWSWKPNILYNAYSWFRKRNELYRVVVHYSCILFVLYTGLPIGLDALRSRWNNFFSFSASYFYCTHVRSLWICSDHTGNQIFKIYALRIFISVSFDPQPILEWEFLDGKIFSSMTSNSVDCENKQRLCVWEKQYRTSLLLRLLLSNRYRMDRLYSRLCAKSSQHRDSYSALLLHHWVWMLSYWYFVSFCF